MPHDPDDAPRPGDPHRDVTGALHDVSNALTVMLGWVSEARAAGTREAVEYALKIIEHRAKVARDLARRAIGASTPSMDGDDTLDAALADAVEALAVEAQRRGVKLARRGEARGARVPLAGDVSQIVTNLLMNAIAHAPRGTEIGVSLDVTEHRVTVEVEDQGPGVPVERRIVIFEGHSTREGGAGVGLRHARAVARAAGGDLELVAGIRPVSAVVTNGASELPMADASRVAEPPLADEPPDRRKAGARFRLTWPRADVMPPPPVSVPRLKLFEGTRVLVVEDDAHVTQLLEAALTVRGAVVTVARDAAELALALRDAPHDAVLIDLSPIAADVDGAFASLTASSPDALMVVISGSAEALPEALASAPVRFVRKPFEVSEIVSALAAGRPR